MFLFSGTFYPLEQLPWGLQAIGWISPLWHSTELGRLAAYGHPQTVTMIAVRAGYLLLLAAVGLTLARTLFTRRLSR